MDRRTERSLAYLVSMLCAVVLTCGLLLAQNTVTTNPRITGQIEKTIPVGAGTAAATLGGVLTNCLAGMPCMAQPCTTAVTTEETLWAWPLPAGVLDTDGRGVGFIAWGTKAANANNVTIRVKFGATTTMNTGFTTSAAAWQIEGRIHRSSATAQMASFVRHFTGSTATVNDTSPAETLSGAVTLALTIQNAVAAANDACVRGVSVFTR